MLTLKIQWCLWFICHTEGIVINAHQWALRFLKAAINCRVQTSDKDGKYFTDVFFIKCFSQTFKKWHALFKFYIAFNQILLMMLWNSPSRSLLWETKWGRVAGFFSYLQLSISRVQFCSSRGYLLKSIMQAAVVVILGRRDRSQTQTQVIHHEGRQDEIIWHHFSPKQIQKKRERSWCNHFVVQYDGPPVCPPPPPCALSKQSYCGGAGKMNTLQLRNPWLASKYLLL